MEKRKTGEGAPAQKRPRAGGFDADKTMELGDLLLRASVAGRMFKIAEMIPPLVEHVKELLKGGANPNVPPLGVTDYHGDNCIAFLISKMILVRIPDSKNEDEFIKVVRLLVEYGADITPNGMREAALYETLDTKALNLMAFLLKHGGDLLTPLSEHSLSPIVMIAISGRFAMLRVIEMYKPEVFSLSLVKDMLATTRTAKLEYLRNMIHSMNADLVNRKNGEFLAVIEFLSDLLKAKEILPRLLRVLRVQPFVTASVLGLAFDVNFKAVLI